MESWEKFFATIREKDYAKSLNTFLDKEYKEHTIFPKREDVFKAFDLVDVDKIKVVIIGQDPYHEVNQAMGLAFSVPEGITLPPSLRNIFKEIENDCGIKMNFQNGDLTYLANQGVLLLNAYLTVRESEPLSHHIKEYDLLMLDIINYINKRDQNIVFLLWGGFAKKYEKYLTNPKFLILKANHPSPLSANRGGFFNEHNFSQCNEFLVENNIKPIDWKN